MLDWVINHWGILFSGVGTSLFCLVVGFLFKKSKGKNITVTQTSGNNSQNYQINGTANIGSKNDK